MGGIKVKVDFTLDSYSDFDNLAMLIMPGGLSWKINSYDEIADFVKEVRGEKSLFQQSEVQLIFCDNMGFLMPSNIQVIL